MRRASVSLIAICALTGSSLLGARTARADPFAYIYGSDSIPYHFAWRSDTGDQKSTETNRTTPFGLQSLAFGAGIGYTGLNAQLDVYNAFSLTTGAVTIGLREKLSLGPVEIWGRIGAGVGLVFDGFSTKIRTTGALATDAEAGIDWYFLQHLGVGLKAVAQPQYSFPKTLSADFGLALELRATI